MYEHDFCEYAVEKKKEGRYLGMLCLSVVLAIVSVVLAIVFVVLFFWMILPAAGFTFGLLIFAAVCLALRYLSRFTFIEYEYTQTGSTLDFAAVYSKQYRREKLSVDLKKSARRVAPCKDGKIGGGFSVSSVLDLRSSASAENAYVLVYEDEKMQKAVLFDATDRLIENIYHQVPSITEMPKKQPE